MPQTVQLLPQWPGSLFELQVWSLLHIVLPDGHDDAHWPPLQTSLP